MEIKFFNLNYEKLYRITKAIKFLLDFDDLKDKFYYKIDELQGNVEINILDYKLIDKIRDFLNAVLIGFSLKDSQKLLKEDYKLVEFNIKDLIVGVRNKKKELRRIMSLIIGEKGKSKKNLENLTKCKLVIDDKKGIIYAIGKDRDIKLLKIGISLILKGLKHGKVWEILEKEIRREKVRKILLEELKYTY